MIELEKENAELKDKIEGLDDNKQIESKSDKEVEAITKKQDNIKEISIGDTIMTDRMAI